MYQVMNRGDRREAIFEDDEDRERLLQRLTQACEKTGWQVHAYCLMGNHFHLVIETPQPNLVVGKQLSAVLGRAVAATELAASGPVVGGVGHPEGQPGGAPGV